jgi:thioredoxin-like negative regulator of GroEL
MIGIIFVFTYLIQATTSIEELSIDTFFDKLSSTDDLTSDNNVVYFYSPWYRSMAKMMPIVETAEAEINGFHYFKVDGTKEVLLAKAMDVSTYPSVYLFKGKDFQKAYFGKPRKKDLFAFLKSNLADLDSQVIKEEKKEVKKEEKKKKKKKIAEEKGNKATKEVAPESTPEPEEEINTEETTTSLPSVLSFNSLVLQQIVKRDIFIPQSKTCQVLLLYSAHHPQERALTQMYDEIASTSKASCVHIAADSDTDQRILTHLQVAQTDLPAIYLLLFDNVPGYPRERRWAVPRVDNLYSSDLQHSLQAIINGTSTREPIWQSKAMMPWSATKSEEEEVLVTREDSTMMIGTEFRQRVVKSDGRDVMVLITASWCEHCKNFAPQWSTVKEGVSRSVSTLTCLQMDGEKNEVFGVEIMSYPTLLLFPALDKERYKTFQGGIWDAKHVLQWASGIASVTFNVETVIASSLATATVVVEENLDEL